MPKSRTKREEKNRCNLRSSSRQRCRYQGCGYLWWKTAISDENDCSVKVSYSASSTLLLRSNACEQGMLLNPSWNFADFGRVQIFWILGTYTLLIINNFNEMFCDVDEWIFHSLSLCLSQFSVYYLCRFVTVCTMKKMWTGGYVMVIFHILSIRKQVFKTVWNMPKKDQRISRTPSSTR